MGIVHIKGPTLIDYLEGRLRARYVREHVEGCEICQTRLRDERLLRALLEVRAEHSASGHFDEDTLAAYLDQRLDPDTMRAIDHHLAACDECLARYLELRRLVDTPADRSVPFRLVAFAREALSTRTLGTLYLNTWASPVRIFYMPEPELPPATPAAMHAHRSVAAQKPPPGARAMRSAASSASSAAPPGMSANRARVREKRREEYVWDSDAVPYGFENSASMGSGKEDLVHAEIPVDSELTLEITAEHGLISVLAIEPASGEPRAGIELVLELDGHAIEEAATGADGTAHLQTPEEDRPARLILRGLPRRTIDLQIV